MVQFELLSQCDSVRVRITVDEERADLPGGALSPLVLSERCR